MNLLIKRAIEQDAQVVAQVLCMSWQSAYKDIIPPAELARHTNTEARIRLFERLISSGVDNFLLALDNTIPCGVCSYRSSRGADMAGWGEIVAIYTTEEGQRCRQGAHERCNFRAAGVWIWLFHALDTRSKRPGTQILRKMRV